MFEYIKNLFGSKNKSYLNYSEEKENLSHEVREEFTKEYESRIKSYEINIDYLEDKVSTYQLKNTILESELKAKNKLLRSKDRIIKKQKKLFDLPKDKIFREQIINAFFKHTEIGVYNGNFIESQGHHYKVIFYFKADEIHIMDINKKETRILRLSLENLLKNANEIKDVSTRRLVKDLIKIWRNKK